MPLTIATALPEVLAVVRLLDKVSPLVGEEPSVLPLEAVLPLTLIRLFGLVPAVRELPIVTVI